MLLRFVSALVIFSIWNAIAHAQSAIILKGKVTDEKHQPVSDATIIDVINNNGTYSDTEGNFSLRIPDHPTTLPPDDSGHRPDVSQ